MDKSIDSVNTTTIKSQQSYTVKTEHFQGPLDLLLNLIEKRKLFINDISLSKVADDFVAYIAQLGHFPMAESAQFILIASTLLLIKSKALLPNLDLTHEEQSDIHDLEERLKLYQRIKELSLHIKKAYGVQIIFEKKQSKARNPVFSPDSSMTIKNLSAAIKDVLENFPKKEFVPTAVIKKVVSLEEMISNLTSRIKTSLKLSFREFANVGKEEKVTIIVSFLAMLELVKQGIVMVNQERDFDDIHIETQEISVPHYS